MNHEWKDFLTRHGAIIEAGIVQHFGDPDAELNATAHGTVLCSLEQFGVLRVSGEDAPSFLQNLLSNDIREVNGSQAQLSSLNTAKGRILATLLIWRGGDDYLLQLPALLLEPLRKKLAMYVLRSKVTIADASDELACLGLSGNKAIELLHEHIFNQVPKDIYAVQQGTHQSAGQSAHIGVIRIGDNRFQINTSPQYAAELWQKLRADAQPVGSLCWDWLNIRSGIPVILLPTQEQFIAQMVNLELIGGVSFKKGCYPGQEIVARTQYLGKLKRRMYLAHIEIRQQAGDIPQAGDELFSADMEGQSSGMIVNAASAPGGGYDVLASIQISSQQTSPVHWKSLQGMVLQFMQLPYQLPDI